MAPEFSWMRRLADCAELMDEALPGETVIEVVGEGRVLIEGHRGVSAYSEEKICVKANGKILIILGSNLKLTQMNTNKLVITGEIYSVHLRKEAAE